MEAVKERKKLLNDSASKMIAAIESDCEVFIQSSGEEVEKKLFGRLEESMKELGTEFVLGEFLKSKISSMQSEIDYKFNVFTELLQYTTLLHSAANIVVREVVTLGVYNGVSDFDKEQCETIKKILKNSNNAEKPEKISMNTINSLIKLLSIMPEFKT